MGPPHPWDASSAMPLCPTLTVAAAGAAAVPCRSFPLRRQRVCGRAQPPHRVSYRYLPSRYLCPALPRPTPPFPCPAPTCSYPTPCAPQVRKRLGDEAADHLVGKEGHQALKVSECCTCRTCTTLQVASTAGGAGGGRSTVPRHVMRGKQPHTQLYRVMCISSPGRGGFMYGTSVRV